jgi:hypothetical protein
MTGKGKKRPDKIAANGLFIAEIEQLNPLD